MAKPNRADYAAKIIVWSKSAHLAVVNPQSGWPSVVEYNKDGNAFRISLHSSPAGDYYRKDYEWRFQNPGNKLAVGDADGYPVLIGIDQVTGQSPILIGLDGTSRVDRVSRFSILFNKGILGEARANGFARYVSGTGESIYAFKPELIETFLDIILAGVDLPAKEVREAAQAAGFNSDESPEAAERTRRAASVLIRDQRFSKKIKVAYGHACAMCGIGIRLNVGAHVYPVSAPNSPDVEQNGICLCANHHTAFDNFDIWVAPKDFSIKFSPALRRAAKASPVVQAFMEQTFSELRLPADNTLAPSKKWLNKRKNFYAKNYAWVR